MSDAKLSAAQKRSIAQLYENESLTDNLTDAGARAVLEWAQAQIAGSANTEKVLSAVRAVNTSSEQDAQALILAAEKFLAHEMDLPTGVSRSDSPSPAGTTDTPKELVTESTAAPDAIPATLSTKPQSQRPGTSGQAGAPLPPDTVAAAKLGATPTGPVKPAKKAASKSKRRKSGTS